MATTLTLSLAAKQARANALATIIGAGGLIKLYTGALPDSPDAPLSSANVLLSTLTGGSAAFAPPAVSTGVNNLVGGIGGSGISPANGTVDLVFSGGGGSGAAGRAVIANGAVASYILTNPGSGYVSAPAVALAAGAGGNPPAPLTVVLGVVLAGNAITPDSAAAASGTPGFARICTATGVAHADLTVGAIGSDAGLRITPAIISAGAPVQCEAVVISEA